MSKKLLPTINKNNNGYCLTEVGFVKRSPQKFLNFAFIILN